MRTKSRRIVGLSSATVAAIVAIVAMLVLPVAVRADDVGRIDWKDHTTSVGPTHPNDSWYWAYTHSYANGGPYVYDGSEPGGILWRLDATYPAPTWVKLTPSASGGYPTQRYNYACLAWSGSRDTGGFNHLVLFGGIARPSGTWLNEVNVYDVATNNWIYRGVGLSPAPTPRAWPGCGRMTVTGTTWMHLEGIVVYGGAESSWTYPNSVWVFCDTTRFDYLSYSPGCEKLGHTRGWVGSWTITPQPVGRYAMSFLDVYPWSTLHTEQKTWNVWGGATSIGVSTNEAWELTFDTLNWRFNYIGFTQYSPPAARYGAGVAFYVSRMMGAFDAGMTIAGGRLAGDTTTNEIWTSRWFSNPCCTAFWTKLTSYGDTPSARWANVFTCIDQSEVHAGMCSEDNRFDPGQDAPGGWYKNTLFGGLSQSGVPYTDTRNGCISSTFWYPIGCPL